MLLICWFGRYQIDIQVSIYLGVTVNYSSIDITLEYHRNKGKSNNGTQERIKEPKYISGWPLNFIF